MVHSLSGTGTMQRHAHHVQMYKPTWTQISTHKLWHSVIISFSCNTENIKHSCNKNYFLNYSKLTIAANVHGTLMHDR